MGIGSNVSPQTSRKNSQSLSIILKSAHQFLHIQTICIFQAYQLEEGIIEPSNLSDNLNVDNVLHKLFKSQLERIGNESGDD